MFGRSYEYTKQPKLLEDGDYKITLKLPYETTVGTYPVLRFPFFLKEPDEDIRPCYFDLFDCIDEDDEEKVKAFRNKASKIVDCFGLKGNFAPETYPRWVGSTGKVRIERSDAGFVNVVAFYKKDIRKAEQDPLF